MLHNRQMKTRRFPRLVPIVIFSEQGLPPGPHTIRLVNQIASWFTVDAFAVSIGTSK